jgi:hypothetical protein
VLGADRKQQKLDDLQAAVKVLARSSTTLPGNEHRLAVPGFLPEAIARHALGHQAVADRALEDALELAEPDGPCAPCPRTCLRRKSPTSCRSTPFPHTRGLCEKPGARSRTEAVERARALGLLAPLPR